MPTRPVSRPVPNLINGVSQQPASLRLASQSEDQVNTYPSVVEGLKQRPPTNHVAKIITGTLGSAYIHTIKRDTTERYIVVVTNGQISVFDLTGAVQTVNFSERIVLLQEAAVAIGDGVEQLIYLPTGTTTVDISSTIETTATITWETSANGTFSDAATLATHSASTSESKTVTSGHTLRARISAWTSGTVDASVTWEDTSYLVDASPNTAIRATSVADFTFVLNKNTVVSMDAGTLSPAGPGGALVSVKQVTHDSNYKVFIDGSEEADFTTASTGAISTANVATELKTDLDAAIGVSYNIDREAYALHITKDDGAAFEAKVQDAKAGTHMNVAVDKVQQFSKLPTVAPTDFTVEVIGDQSSSFDNYFVKFAPTNSGATFDEGTWNETVGPGLQTDFLAHTMPHTLVREANGTFTFGAASWGGRIAGDEVSAPDPSFVGAKINDVFFHKNRLGFLADDNVIMSRAGEFFDFFTSTVTTFLESDPIDVAATDSSGDSTSVSILRHGVAFDEKLLLFADQAQFILEGGNLLTPQSVSINVVTEYEADITARPVGAGKNVYFPVPNGDFSGLREMFVQAETLVKDAADVTAHVPAFVPATPIKLAAASNESIVVALTEGDQTRLYPYKFFWSGDQKLQSAWSEWLFNGDTVLNIDFIENTMFVILQRSDAVYLESLNVQPKLTDPDQTHLDKNARWLSHLDRRVTEADAISVVYSAITDQTTWELPYEVKTGQAMKIVTRAHVDALDDPGVILQGVVVDDMDDTKLLANGDFSGANNKVFIGETYQASYTFSEQVLKEDSFGGGQSSIGSARLDMKMWSLAYARSGFFQVEVTHAHRPTPSIYKFTGRILGDPSNKIGQVSLPTGIFKFPVLAKSDKVEVKITSDHFLPMAIQSAEWTAEMSIQFPRS